ncbi:MAG: hypothetical protein AAFP16_09615 [Pseudomonadota bacterium]
MARAHLFQDFGSIRRDDPGSGASSVEIEEQKLQSFEDGYQAGWDDAVRAQSQSVQHVSSALAANLQDASFQYHEMRAALNKSAQGILQQIVQTTLPKVAQASLGARICEEVTAQVRSALEAKIVIAVAPGSFEAVKATLSETLSDPFDVIADTAMPPDQAVLRIDQSETEIDMARVLSEIDGAVSAFFATDDTEVTHD